MPATSARGSRARYDVTTVGSGVGGSVAAGVLAPRGKRLLDSAASARDLVSAQAATLLSFSLMAIGAGAGVVILG